MNNSGPQTQKVAKIYFTADWHLGNRQYGLIRRETDFYKAAINFIESVEPGSIIINAGDLFDSTRPKLEAICALDKIKEILSRKGCDMFYAPGNHDRIGSYEGKPVHWVDIFGSSICRMTGNKWHDCIYNMECIGFPEMPKESLIEALNNVVFNDNKKLKILMLHASCKEFCSFASASALSIDEIPNLEKYNYVVIGDTHVHKCIKKGDTYIMSPGSIEMVSASEPFQKFCYAISCESLEPVDIKLNSRLCLGVTINTQEELDKVIDEIRENYYDKDPLLYVTAKAGIVGLNKIEELFDLNKAVVRYKIISTDNANDISSVDNDLDQVLSINDFVKSNLTIKSRTPEIRSTLEALCSLDIGADSVDDIINKFIDESKQKLKLKNETQNDNKL